MRNLITFTVLGVLNCTPAPTEADAPALTVETVVTGLNKPVYVTALPGNEPRLVVVEQRGVLRVVEDQRLHPQPFLDITDRVHNPLAPGDERGLLGLAFHPDYRNNGYFYLNYIDREGYTVIARYQVTPDPLQADPGSEQVLLRLAQPFSNHNGGHLAFGPRDGYLYIALGDGGSGGDPYNHAQRLDNLFGKILRIDVDGASPYAIPEGNPFSDVPGARPEIWVYGLRNPWRFSFDRATGDLYIGDVGQNRWEEIDFQAADSPGGLNYGWRIMEGNHCYQPPAGCDTAGLTPPIFEYPNNANYSRTLLGLPQQSGITGCSVTGGYVYRGRDIPELQGTYFFSDYCSGRIWSFRLVAGRVTDFRDWTATVSPTGTPAEWRIASFGEDAAGELYLVDHGGNFFKLAPSE
jgi:glucose/arabinose dehydrogenase